MDPASNPLSKHFRQPKTYIKLPSDGNWWPEGSLDMPPNHELPVFSMTGRDELMMRNADALMNGNATVEMIQSCMPNIKDGWNIPRSDLDVIILAIRIATYGPEMNVNSRCPHCEAQNENTVDCRWVLDNIQQPEWDKMISLGDLLLKLRPAPYRVVNELNLDSYEENKLIAQLSQEGLSDDQRRDIMLRTMKKMAGALADRLAASIESIITPEGQKVSNQSMIRDFINNADKGMFDALRTAMAEFSAGYNLPRMKIQCESCDKVYETNLEFDPANFFALAS